MIKIKVCGMSVYENILDVARLHPNYIGFIFYRGSKRYVGADFTIPPGFPYEIEKVGVFVNETTEEISRLANQHKLDLIQLHGDEPAGQCEDLRKKGFKVIKAFSIDKEFDFHTVAQYRYVVDYFLFDTKGGQYGGNGVVFNWGLLDRYDQQVPFFLSGGISPLNIAEIGLLKGMNLHAVDVNSGVEENVGIKDVKLITELYRKMDKWN